MILKPGVRVLGLQPEMVLALVVMEGIYAQFGQQAFFVVTSVVEGTHRRASLHYTGCAADLRKPPTGGEQIVAAGKAALGEDYDVIFETDHLHVEFQPKAPY